MRCRVSYRVSTRPVKSRNASRYLDCVHRLYDIIRQRRSRGLSCSSECSPDNPAQTACAKLACAPPGFHSCVHPRSAKRSGVKTSSPRMIWLVPSAPVFPGSGLTRPETRTSYPPESAHASPHDPQPWHRAPASACASSAASFCANRLLHHREGNVLVVRAILALRRRRKQRFRQTRSVLQFPPAAQCRKPPAVARYSFHPDPARYPRATHSTGNILARFTSIDRPSS